MQFACSSSHLAPPPASLLYYSLAILWSWGMGKVSVPYLLLSKLRQEINHQTSKNWT